MDMRKLLKVQVFFVVCLSENIFDVKKILTYSNFVYYILYIICEVYIILEMRKNRSIRKLDVKE